MPNLAYMLAVAVANAGALQGVVSDDDGVPIPYAVVSVCTAPCTAASLLSATDLDGGFTFSDLAPGSYIVKVEAAYWEPDIDVVIIADQAVAHNVRIIPQSAGTCERAFYDAPAAAGAMLDLWLREWLPTPEALCESCSYIRMYTRSKFGVARLTTFWSDSNAAYMRVQRRDGRAPVLSGPVREISDSRFLRIERALQRSGFWELRALEVGSDAMCAGDIEDEIAVDATIRGESHVVIRRNGRPHRRTSLDRLVRVRAAH